MTDRPRDGTAGRRMQLGQPGCRERTSARLFWTGVGSAGVSLLVLTTALGSASRLGAPAYWPWLLTGAQVTALWAAGASRWWGWPLGAAVQPPWIVYAVVTGQLGFIPGCLISGAVQTVSFVRAARHEPTPEHGARLPGGAARRHPARVLEAG